MKYILTLGACAVALFCSVSLFADEVEKQQTATPTIIMIVKSGTSITRSSVNVPLEAVYYPSLSTIGVSFFYDLGYADIEVVNLTTGESYVWGIDACAGMLMLPIPYASGEWLIYMFCDNGDVYTGEFTVE